MTMTCRTPGEDVALASRPHTEVLDAPTCGGWTFSVWPQRPATRGPGFYALNSSRWCHELTIGYISGDPEAARRVIPGLLGRIVRQPRLSPRSRLTDCGAYLAPLLRREMYCSAWCGVFLDDGTLLYSNAGHPPPLLRRRGVPSRLLEAGGIPFGTEQSVVASERRIRVRGGEELFVRADGLRAGFPAETAHPLAPLTLSVRREPAVPFE